MLHLLVQDLQHILFRSAFAHLHSRRGCRHCHRSEISCPYVRHLPPRSRSPWLRTSLQLLLGRAWRTSAQSGRRAWQAVVTLRSTLASHPHVACRLLHSNLSFSLRRGTQDFRQDRSLCPRRASHGGPPTSKAKDDKTSPTWGSRC